MYRVLREVVPSVALILLSHEDSHRWWVEIGSRTPPGAVGARRKLGTGRWSYSRVMQALGSPLGPHAQRACGKPAAYLLGMQEFILLENTALFPLTDLFQRLLQFQAEEPLTRNWETQQMLSQYRLPLEESVPLFAPLLSCLSLNITILP